MSGRQIPDRLIASALEFAVGIAAAGARTKPALPFPSELRPFLRFQKLTGRALADVRRAVEGDPLYLERLGSVATPELLDDAGMLWLTRPEGWAEQLLAMAETAECVDQAAELRRAERRRQAAEQVAERALAEIAALRAETSRLGETAMRASSEAADLRRERYVLQSEATRHQLELRHALDRVAAAIERAERSEREAAVADARAAEAERTRDDVLAARVAAGAPADSVLAGAASLAGELGAQVDSVNLLAKELARLAGSLAALEPAVRAEAAGGSPQRGRSRRRSTRQPVALPGGVYGSSFAAAEFLARQEGVVLLVDGYNVAKLRWPRLTLAHQRERCIDAAEDVARRFGTQVAVVFDGADVEGASAPSRRLVRVRYSPQGVSADDVLAAEVAALPPTMPIVVVTNDQAVATDVRSHGANTMTSEQFLELAGR